MIHGRRESLSSLRLLLHPTVELIVEGLVLRSFVSSILIGLIWSVVHLEVLLGLTLLNLLLMLLLVLLLLGNGLLDLLTYRRASLASLRGVAGGHVCVIPHGCRCKVAHQHRLLLLLR